MSADLRALTGVCAVIVAVGFGAGVLGVADQLAAGTLLAAGTAWLVLRRVRQELRIRRRLADTAGIRPAATCAHGSPPFTSCSTSSTPHASQIPRAADPVERVTERTGGAA